MAYFWEWAFTYSLRYSIVYCPLSFGKICSSTWLACIPECLEVWIFFANSSFSANSFWFLDKLFGLALRIIILKLRLTCTERSFHQNFSIFQICKEIAESEYPQLQFESMIIDNASMQLVYRPQQFDIILLPNLYGNIISNIACGLIGGAGLVSGVNVGSKYAVFETVCVFCRLKYMQLFKSVVCKIWKKFSVNNYFNMSW